MFAKLLTLACLPLAACTFHDPLNIGMANPASTHCLSKDGFLETKTAADGSESALCHLPDGNIVEEWQLFHHDNPQS